jgi:hypothetical protein
MYTIYYKVLCQDHPHQPKSIRAITDCKCAFNNLPTVFHFAGSHSDMTVADSPVIYPMGKQLFTPFKINMVKLKCNSALTVSCMVMAQ